MKIDSEKQNTKVDYIWECTCPCHKAGRVVIHPVPCCEPCPHCNKKVARGALTKHLKDCKKYQKA